MLTQPLWGLVITLLAMSPFLFSHRFLTQPAWGLVMSSQASWGLVLVVTRYFTIQHNLHGV